jgi:hypothetical protein
VIVFENSSEQSDRRQVLIPARIEPTPTPLPQFTLDLTIDQPNVDTLIVNVVAPDDVTLESAELYINNQLIEKIVAAPFDQFEVNIEELGSGKHSIRVEALAENGATASTEVELTLTIPPTPLPTIPPTVQPTPTAAPPADSGLTIPMLAIVLIVAGLVLLMLLAALVGYFLFFQAKRPVAQAPPPVNPLVTARDDPAFETIRTPVTPIEQATPARQAGLVVLTGQHVLSQTKFNLDKAEVKIGRNTAKEASNEIAIEDGQVSRSHAKIVCRDQQYFIQDLGSATGTKVNGQKLKAYQEITLQNGAEIAIGPKVKFKFISVPLQAGNVTLDDWGGGEFQTEDDDDPHRTLFDYDPRQ